MESYSVIITREQVEELCKKFGVDINEIENWEVCELVNEAIDKYCC